MESCVCSLENCTDGYIEFIVALHCLGELIKLHANAGIFYVVWIAWDEVRGNLSLSISSLPGPQRS